MEIIITIFLFLFGIVIGSFLNVCIVRWPHEKSVVRPRSHCPKCAKVIRWYDNIPLLSYLILGGKCRHCKTKISFRYFLVELISGLSFVLFYYFFGLDVLLVPYLFMMGCFIIATFVDFEHRIIPDEVSVGGMCVGLVMSLLIPSMHVLNVGDLPWYLLHLKSFGISLLGVIIGGGCIYLMGMLGDWMFKKESMGGGDIKFLAMVGAFLGWEKALLAFFIAPFFGAVYGIIEKIRVDDTAIAYGPFLVLGSLIALFYGDPIIAWIIGGYGIRSSF